jgi:hypothetical protein
MTITAKIISPAIYALGEWQGSFLFLDADFCHLFFSKEKSRMSPFLTLDKAKR